MVVALVDDLLFSSKIQAACRVAGVGVHVVRRPDAAQAAVRAQASALLVLDLDSDALKALSVIDAVRADASLAGVRVAAFARHTSTDRIAAARRAGADVVLARSAFFPALPGLIADAVGGAASPPGTAPSS